MFQKIFKRLKRKKEYNKEIIQNNIVFFCHQNHIKIEFKEHNSIEIFSVFIFDSKDINLLNDFLNLKFPLLNKHIVFNSIVISTK